ncbi:IDEAL domain-containing protein [Bacillus sp. AK128]
MKERPSYSDIHKAKDQTKEITPENVNIYVQMLLDEILIKARIEKLLIEIDYALEHRDYTSFQRLSNEYKQLIEGS